MADQQLSDNIAIPEAEGAATMAFLTLPVPFLRIPIRLPFTRIGLKRRVVVADNRYSFDVPEIEQRTIVPQTVSSSTCLKQAGFASLPPNIR